MTGQLPLAQARWKGVAPVLSDAVALAPAFSSSDQSVQFGPPLIDELQYGCSVVLDHGEHEAIDCFRHLLSCSLLLHGPAVLTEIYRAAEARR